MGSSLNTENDVSLVQADPLSEIKMKGDYSPRESFENLRTNYETNRPPEKAYVQQLESSRVKLSQLEQELERARSQVKAALQQGSRCHITYGVERMQFDDCKGCNIRFNAEKKQVGNYYSTKIWSFSMKAPCCKQEIVIQTDPKNCMYVIMGWNHMKLER